MSISVLIPTRNRPELLSECINSVLKQSRKPLEIVVGDDSDDLSTFEQASLQFLSTTIPIRRLFHNPPAGQAVNIQSLFDTARGDRLLLLHDDDTLLPGALSVLDDALDEHPEAVAAFGKQRLITNDGRDLGDTAAAELNATFARTTNRAGVQHSLVSAILRQFPNDGYILDVKAARSAGYLGHKGDAVDAAFGIRLAKSSGRPFIFVNQETCNYRLTKGSVARTNPTAAGEFYNLLLGIKVDGEAALARRTALSSLAPTAAREHARAGRSRHAIIIWAGPHYGWRRVMPRGLYCLVSTLLPSIDRLRKASQNG